MGDVAHDCASLPEIIAMSCSTFADTQKDQQRVAEKLREKLSTCAKCPEKPVVVIRSQLAFCGPCFARTTSNKFRGWFSKSRDDWMQKNMLVYDWNSGKPKELKIRRSRVDWVSSLGAAAIFPKILVAYSGGPGSGCMLNMIREYEQDSIQRGPPLAVGKAWGETGQRDVDINVQRRFPEIVVGHVDESVVYNDSDGVRSKERRSAIGRDVSLSPYESVIVRLETVFGTDSDPNGNAENMKALFKAAGTGTSQEDLVAQLRQRLLVDTARRLKCNVIIMGDSASRIAVRTVAELAKGRGFVLPYTTAPVSNALPDIEIWKPMRDISNKEIAVYNRLEKVPVYPQPNLPSWDFHSSIDRMTEEFVAGLDRDFPATVSTVVRTVTKLRASDEATAASSLNQRCYICDMPVQAGSDTWKEHRTVNGGVGVAANRLIARAGGTTMVCYGCRVNFDDYINVDDVLFPAGTTRTGDATENVRRQIAEFLITD